MTTRSTPRTQEKRTTLKRLAGMLAVPLVLVSLWGSPALAAGEYPSKTVKIVVNFPPGGPADVVARLVADKLQASLKQTFIVENASGAGGNIGAGAVAKADPDGHTILVTIDTPLTMNPSLYPSMPFKDDDLKPVIMLGSAGSLIAVHPSIGASSLKALIARGKKESITFSSAGNGSPGHIASAMLTDASGMKITHIPYRGNAPAVTALIAGEVQAGILATPGLVPHVKAGKVKPVAVAGSQRSTLLPDVPTTAELGYPGVEMEFMFIAMVPSKTPEAVVDVLYKSMASAMAQPDVQERLRSLDFVPAKLSAAQVTERLEKTRERYARIIKATGMKAE